MYADRGETAPALTHEFRQVATLHLSIGTCFSASSRCLAIKQIVIYHRYNTSLPTKNHTETEVYNDMNFITFT